MQGQEEKEQLSLIFGLFIPVSEETSDYLRESITIKF